MHFSINFKTLLLVGLIFAAFAPRSSAQENFTAPVYELIVSDPDRALEVVRELRHSGESPSWQLDIAEGDVYFGMKQHRKALELYRRAQADKGHLDDRALDCEFELTLLHRIISCLDNLHLEREKVFAIQELLDKSRACQSEHMVSVALFSMGKTIYRQGDSQGGYKMMEEAVQIMSRSEYGHKYENLRYEYSTLVRYYMEDGLYDKALKRLKSLEKIVLGTQGFGTEISGLREKELKALYAQRAVAYMNLGRESKADAQYEKWKKVAPDYTMEDYLIGPYLTARGLYDKALDIYREREALFCSTADTINYYNRSLKRSMAQAYEAKGDFDRAGDCYIRFSVITDSLKCREQKSLALEYAMLNEVEAQEKVLVEQEADIKLRNVIIGCSVFVVISLVIVLMVQLYHISVLRRKNKVLAEHLKDLKKINQPHSGGDEEGRSDFENMDRMIRDTKIYLDPTLSRNVLMELTGMNKNRLARVVHDFAGVNLSGYINALRVEHALGLLESNTFYKIEAIAKDSGFPSRRTFYRQFRECTGMSPTEYRTALH